MHLFLAQVLEIFRAFLTPPITDCSSQGFINVASECSQVAFLDTCLQAHVLSNSPSYMVAGP